MDLPPALNCPLLYSTSAPSSVAASGFAVSTSFARLAISDFAFAAITTGSREQATIAAKDIAARGFRTIKLKVGGGPMSEDADRIHAIVTAAPGLSLILDGNCGVRSVADALAILAAAARAGATVVLFEQPLAKDDRNGQRALVERSPVPIAAEPEAARVNA